MVGRIAGSAYGMKHSQLHWNGPTVCQSQAGAGCCLGLQVERCRNGEPWLAVAGVSGRTDPRPSTSFSVDCEPFAKPTISDEARAKLDLNTNKSLNLRREREL